ncbi:MAG: hypothetical protein LBQ34_00530 [Alphaproteobacteria bacterium]|jgi:hypothetical protein|nr:hypothetical protein [Alphaproteobacteria bacterium]
MLLRVLIFGFLVYAAILHNNVYAEELSADEAATAQEEPLLADNAEIQDSQDNPESQGSPAGEPPHDTVEHEHNEADTWLNNNQKNSVNLKYNEKYKETLSQIVFNKFQESAIKVSFFNLAQDHVKVEDFIVLDDLSVLYYPISSVSARFIVNSSNNMIDGISIVANFADNKHPQDTLKVMGVLVEIAVAMINIDITKHDVANIYSKIYKPNAILNNYNYESNIVIGRIVYSVYFIRDSLVFKALRLAA